MEETHALILYQNKLIGEGLERILHKNKIIVNMVSFNELTNLGLLKPNFNNELLLIETNWPFRYLDRLVHSNNYWFENGNKTILIPNIINKNLIRIIQNANIDGIVLISGDSEELFFAIKQVLEGKKYFSTVLSNIYMNMGTPVDFHKVTKREKEILLMLAKKYSTKEIANILSISPATVKTHRRNLMKKFNTKSLFSLLQIACRENILNDGINVCNCCRKQFISAVN